MMGLALFRKRCLVSRGNLFLFRSFSVPIGKDSDAAAEITVILNQVNWRDALVSSNLSIGMNPDVLLSVLRSKFVDDPTRLLSFFNWIDSQKVTEQKLDSFSCLASVLCSFGSFGKAHSVLIRMIERNWPVADVWCSVVRCSKEFAGKSDDGALYGILIDGYIEKGFLDEAVFVISSSMDLDLVPDLARCNHLLDALLKRNRLDSLWDVYNKMVERNVVCDSQTHEMLIVAHCRDVNVHLAKNALLKTEEEFGTATLNMYSLVLEVLCKRGDLNEALELKKSMIFKGLVPVKQSYNMIIDGLCKQKRLEEAKSLLAQMNSFGVFPDNVAYSLLIDGLLKGRDSDAANRLVHVC